MFISDLLKDSALFFTVTVAISAFGQEEKSTAALFGGASIPCRLEGKGQRRVESDPGTQEKFTERWELIVETEFGTANRGDKVTIDSVDYEIVSSKFERGLTGNIDHHIYTLQQTDDA